MNALTRSARTLIPRAKTGTRSMASGSSSTSFSLAELKNNVWLSDPGAYPVIAVLAFACGMCGVFSTRTLMKNPDVRIDMKKRQSVMRTWDNNMSPQFFGGK